MECPACALYQHSCHVDGNMKLYRYKSSGTYVFKEFNAEFNSVKPFTHITNYKFQLLFRTLYSHMYYNYSFL